MKADEDVKMISAEAPILFAKGCDVFITELTMRAWIHAEESKRRTLQRSDIASALQKSDMFDFLIDIVPREEAAANAGNGHGHNAYSASLNNTSSSSAPVPNGHHRRPSSSVQTSYAGTPAPGSRQHSQPPHIPGVQHQVANDELQDDSDEFEQVVDGVDELSQYHVVTNAEGVDDGEDAFVQYHLPGSTADVIGGQPENQLDSVYGAY